MSIKAPKPNMVNYMAIELLETLGNVSPTQQQINDTEILVKTLIKLLSQQEQASKKFFTQKNYLVQMIHRTMISKQD